MFIAWRGFDLDDLTYIVGDSNHKLVGPDVGVGPGRVHPCCVGVTEATTKQQTWFTNATLVDERGHKREETLTLTGHVQHVASPTLPMQPCA